MEVPSPNWKVQDLLYGKHDKWTRITLACKGKCFQIEISPENFVQSPSSFQRYSRYIDLMYDDENAAEAAEDDLYDWVLAPFLPIFDQVEPSLTTGKTATLRDYLSPEIYYFQLYFVDERMEPRYDYEVRRTLREPGVDIGDFALHPNWGKFTPEMVEQCLSDGEYGYSKHPRKVCVDGKLCFLKESHTKRGLLHCEKLTLSCALHDEVTFAQQKKWEEQITTTVDLLHRADIIWGDVKTDNVLIDKNEDAWVIDFGGGYTEGWVAKEHMETMKGDAEGLSRIMERIYSNDGSQDGGQGSHEEEVANVTEG
ncbi:hypothetical protein AnigIFM63326_006016 [Aspergillus niger]|nr:hypothetical protein AnigIFM63326_006016 [Aspergillus niger]